MRLVLFVVLLGAVYAAPNRRLAPVNPATGTVIEDEYIVVFSEDVTDEQVERHHHKLTIMMTQYNGTQRVMDRYHIGNFRGYAGHFGEKTLEHIREEAVVKYIDHNQVMKAYQGNCVQQAGATWGLVRTSVEDYTRSDTTYEYSADGEGVDAYIIDTGIDISHPDFGGRAKYGADYVNEGFPEDANGHGTHVAGTVMSETYGLAKKATAIAVKVLGRSGSGTTAGVTAGVNYVGNEHTSSKKSVANMSLGGGRSTSLNAAVTAAINKGVHFALAAGNDYKSDACFGSPGSTEEAVTVASSTQDDKLSSFTNVGTCVNIIAPGSSITSTWLNGGTNTISGTSMASPHVAGVIAKILSNENLTPEAMKERLRDIASKDKITDITDSDKLDNYLLYKGC